MISIFLWLVFLLRFILFLFICDWHSVGLIFNWYAVSVLLLVSKVDEQLDTSYCFAHIQVQDDKCKFIFDMQKYKTKKKRIFDPICTWESTWHSYNVQHINMKFCSHILNYSNDVAIIILFIYFFFCYLLLFFWTTLWILVYEWTSITNWKTLQKTKQKEIWVISVKTSSGRWT